MIIGVLKETFPGERRVALTPDHAAQLIKDGNTVLLEKGAGESAGFTDQAYADGKAELLSSREKLLSRAEAVLQVRTLGANPVAGRSDLPNLYPGQVLIGMGEPLTAHEATRALGERKVTQFSLELIPRITRAQSMDVLSSMATVSGYKAALLAALSLPRFFPMFMTAAGTIAPARVFVMGAGVAGLQAIATAKRLGAVVKAYDLRAAAKEQVESLGARFVELPLEPGDAETKGGYAKAMDEDFYRRQRELLARIVRESDVIITTAAVPGRKAPVLFTAEMMKAMAPGSVVVDVAAERGGNCELTRPGETVVVDGVEIQGPVNLPATVPYHASQMYAKNIVTFFRHLAKKGEFRPDWEDEIVKGTLVLKEGEIVNPAVLEAMGRTAPQ